MPKPLFRIKPYKNSKYKFVVRGKIDGKWTRRYFISDAEAKAFAKEQNSALDDAPGRQAPSRGRASVPLQQSSLIELADVTTPVYRGPRIQRYLGDSWCMHLPFAYDLMRTFAPKIFVELGVKQGESYFTFCQSAAENHINVRCYGIDSWKGDVQTGPLDPEIQNEVVEYNWQYSSFSELRPMLFEEALAEFPEGSIDLLHIDGTHTYAAVKADFESWLPKLSSKAIVLFHDVILRDRGFGVWKLWEEIYIEDRSFLFEFGYGLGVWKKEAVTNKDAPFIQKLFRAPEAEKQDIKNFYATAATALALWQESQKNSDEVKKISILRRDAALLQNENEEKTRQVAHFKSDAEEKAKHNALLLRENEEKTRQVLHFKSEAEEKAKHNALLLRENEEKTSQVGHFKSDAEEKAKHVALLLRENEEKTKQVAHFKSDVEEKAKHNALLLRDNEEKTKQVAHFKSEAEEKAKHNALLLRENEEKTKQVFHFKSEAEEKTKHNALLLNENKDKESHLTRLKRDLSAQMEQCAELQRELERLRDRLERQTESLRQAEETARDARSEALTLRKNALIRDSSSENVLSRIAELQSRIRLLESERVHSREAVTRLLNDLTESQRLGHDLEEQVRTARKQLAETKTAHRKQMKRLGDLTTGKLILPFGSRHNRIHRALQG